MTQLQKYSYIGLVQPKNMVNKQNSDESNIYKIMMIKDVYWDDPIFKDIDFKICLIKQVDNLIIHEKFRKLHYHFGITFVTLHMKNDEILYMGDVNLMISHMLMELTYFYANFKCKTKQFTNFLYLIRKRSCVNSKENIYKIGRTNMGEPLDRFKGYENGYEFYFMIGCDNSVKNETKILKLLKENPNVTETDYGKESFQADRELIINIMINNIISKDEIKNEKKENPVSKKIIKKNTIVNINPNISNCFFSTGQYCFRCGRVFESITAVKKHLSKIKPCNAQILIVERDELKKNYNKYINKFFKEVKKNKIPISQPNNTCKYCNRNFINKSSLNRHINKYCKIAQMYKNDEYV